MTLNFSVMIITSFDYSDIVVIVWISKRKLIEIRESERDLLK